MVLSSASQLVDSDNRLSQPRRCQTVLRGLTLVVEDVEEEGSGVEIDAAVVCVLLIVSTHLMPPWRRAGLIPLRGCRASAPAERSTAGTGASRDPVLPWREVRPVAIEAMRCIQTLHPTRPCNSVFAPHWLVSVAHCLRGRAGEQVVRRH